MKRCPQCGRDYDATMSFCLDDGSELLYGPASASEDATAIIHSTDVSGDALTRQQIHATDRSSMPSFPSAARPIRRDLRIDKFAIFIGLIAAISGTAFVGYRYFGSATRNGITSIAVLPFQNRSSDTDTEYLSDGLAESLIYRLSQIPELKVSPRSSAFRYRGQEVDPEKVGAELGVDAVISGRLVQRGDNLAISVDLVDVRSNKTLWGEQFERKISDLLSTQREIASAIVDKLQIKLSGTDSRATGKRYTENNEAYQLYLKGRFFWNRRTSENLKKAVEQFKAAAEKDPGFALAYAGLADCYVVSYYYVGERTQEILPLARTYAAKAIELDPTLAEPHATLGLASWFLDWDKAEAEREFLRAIELNPNYPTARHWYSRFLRGVGRFDDAYREIKRAEELEPLSIIFINNIAEMAIDRGELDAAADLCRRMFELEPNFWAAHQTYAIVLVMQGRLPEALTEAQRSVELSNRSNAALALLGHVYAGLGRRGDAEAVIKELETRHSNKSADCRDLAVVYAGMRDSDTAFQWLEKGYQEHSVFLAFLNLEPMFQPLHADPRWKGLKKRVGLPE